MKIQITQDHVFSHPEYRDCIIQKNASKSKTASTVPLDKWKWYYDWCERIEGTSFAYMLTHAPVQESCKEIIKRRIAHTMVTLMLCHGSCRYYTPLREVPQQIRDHIRASEKATEAERKRVKALSPAERVKELDEALRALAGPGFAAFGHPSHPAIQAAKRAGVKVIPFGGGSK